MCRLVEIRSAFGILLMVAMSASTLLGQSGNGASGAIARPIVAAKHVVKQHPYWTASVFANLTASMADGASSSYILDYRHTPGVVETNPAIVGLNHGNNRTFGVGGFAFKLGFWAAQTGIQAYFLHRNAAQSKTLSRIYTISNFASAGFFSALAVHNSRYGK
jgi:hypothetical protein